MNVILDTSNFSLSNIFFADKKRNVIVNGHFTKVIFSNDNLVLNNIYYHLPLIKTDITANCNELYIQYDIQHKANIVLLQNLAEIEYRILNYYKQVHNLTVAISTHIDKKLQCGKLKVFCEENRALATVTNIVVKISGIWETTDEIGLAIKFCPGNVYNLSN